ncbi:DUF2058 domain-containing protein [Flocculibacter collagenilyticus]|uniref:DUF2058 domain-containing protein n=1 Tax=Flocculibacter collagenilyticus TaxID=2744479 RepID=UPI0018F4A36F|nr:DUF2058 domain-containing protein [Flocculibacter collagenilyticus]
MGSLADQLLKAGLTTKQKAKQANTAKRKQQKQQRKGNVAVEDDLKKEIEQAKQAKLEKDRELAAQKKAELTAKENKAAVKQMVLQHHIKDSEGESVFNFTYDNKVKELKVTESLRNSLAAGTVGVCAVDKEFYLLPAELIQRIATRDDSVIACLHDQDDNQVLDEDDPYADYVIPDDLMW